MSEKCFGQIVYSMNLHPDHLCEPPLLLRTDKFNLPKILNGPKDNKACKTAASVEMLNGLENPHGVRLPKKLCKCSKRWLKEDSPLGGVLFFKSKFLVSCTWTCHDPVGHTSNSTVTTSTGDSHRAYRR